MAAKTFDDPSVLFDDPLPQFDGVVLKGRFQQYREYLDDPTVKPPVVDDEEALLLFFLELV